MKQGDSHCSQSGTAVLAGDDNLIFFNISERFLRLFMTSQSPSERQLKMDRWLFLSKIHRNTFHCCKNSRRTFFCSFFFHLYMLFFSKDEPCFAYKGNICVIKCCCLVAKLGPFFTTSWTTARQAPLSSTVS